MSISSKFLTSQNLTSRVKIMFRYQKNSTMNGHFFYCINQEDLKQLQQSSVSPQRPSLIGYYESNYENILPGKKIKYFYYPNSLSFPIYLEDEEENVIHSINLSKPQRLQLPLYYAMSNANAANATTTEDGKLQTTVYGGCRALSMIMQSYWSKYDFAVAISRYNGSLFIAGSPNLSIRKDHQHIYRLEQLLFKDSPHDSQRKPLDQNIFYSALFRATIGNFDIIYATDVQGINANEKFKKFDDLDAINGLNFVSLRQMFKNTKNKEPKLILWWLQSYLSNVKDIYLATKTFNGTISDPLKHIKVSEIPKACNSWMPQMSFGLLMEYLTKVEHLMANVNSFDTVYEFKFDATEKTFYYNIYEGKTEKSFIPQTYADFVLKK